MVFLNRTRWCHISHYSEDDGTYYDSKGNVVDAGKVQRDLPSFIIPDNAKLGERVSDLKPIGTVWIHVEMQVWLVIEVQSVTSPLIFMRL